MDRSRTKAFLKRGRASVLLIAAAVLLLVAGASITASGTRGPYRLSGVEFANTHSGDRERVSGLLFIPEAARRDAPAPGVVFAHGLATSKEFYLPFCRELASRGMVVLAIDLPGHGRSQGHCDLGAGEHTAVRSAYDWLVSNVNEADPARVIAAGHSLGGVSSVMAAAQDDRGRFSGVAAIYCWPGFDQVLCTVFGGLDELTRAWPFLAWSRDFRLDDAAAMEERRVTSRLSAQSPPNFLLVTGTYDEACTAGQSIQVMAAACGGGPPEPGATVGSFDQRTARKVLLTGDSHLTEPVSPTVFAAVYNWARQCAGLAEEPAHPSLLPRYAGWLLVLAGCLLAGAAVSVGVFSATAPGAPGGSFPVSAWVTPSASLAFAGCACFLAVSLSSLPLARLLGLTALVRFAAGDVLSSIALTRAPLLLALMLLLAAIASRGLGHVRGPGWRAPAGRAALGAAAALAGFAVFAALYRVFANRLHLGPGLPYSWPAFLFFALALAAELWVTGAFFHALVLPAFEARENGNNRVKYLLTEATARAAGQALVFLPAVSGVLYVVGRQGSLRVPALLLVLLVSWPAYLALAWLNLKTRLRGGSLLAPSLFAALLSSWLLTALLSVR